MYADNFIAILNYARRRVRQSDDAPDLVAETFLVAWRRRSEVPPGDHGRLWLYGVARLVLANHARGEQRRRRLGQRLRLEHREYPVTVDAGNVDVRDALARLAPNDREVLELTVWEQLTPTEIAVALGLSPEVVRTRLRRARTRLRSQLECHAPGPAGQELAVRAESELKGGKP
nr:sigma-70 family RNA polymerase sigma factor [Kineosporia babensis]